MNYFLRKISKLEFKNSNVPTLLGTYETDKVFSLISNKRKAYKFSWKSELVDPIIKEWNNVCVLGIDLDLVILNFETNEILNRLQFDSFFYDIQFYHEVIYVITQLEVFRINSFDFKIIDTYPLPDVFKKIEMKDGSIVIECFGGELIFVTDI